MINKECVQCKQSFSCTSKNRRGLCHNCKYININCTECGHKFQTISFQKQTTLCYPCRNRDTCKRSAIKNKAQRIEGRKKQREKNPDYTKNYRKQNLEREVQRDKDWYRKNKTKKLLQDKKRREANREADRLKRRTVEWRSRSLADTNKRRARKLNCTPSWSQDKEIRDFYLRCPKGYAVDHIIPLHGDTVAGFHILENLQYLPKAINLKKSNRLLSCYEHEEAPFCVIDIAPYLE